MLKVGRMEPFDWARIGRAEAFGLLRPGVGAFERWKVSFDFAQDRCFEREG
jgi:hypothetical protein